MPPLWRFIRSDMALLGWLPLVLVAIGMIAAVLALAFSAQLAQPG
jgi:hypothetical protein